MTGVMSRMFGSGRYTLFAVFFLALAALLFSRGAAWAAEEETEITAESLEYLAEERKYVAHGSVTVQQEGAVIRADEIIYYEDTSEVFASGSVTYDDGKASISARKAELNLDRKTGRLFEAEILFREENYRVSGTEIERRGENEYYSPDASFTTCDAPVPAWCFKGREVDLRVGDRITARDASFRIRNVPVLYTPYLWAPIVTERQTGFLMPVVSQSSSRGFGLKIPFFWEISDERDATFVLDYYSKRGLGAGIEYRYVAPGGVSGSWWAYHLRDRELKKNFFEMNALHEARDSDGLGGFLSVNYVNKSEFYREYSPQFSIRVQRFLESTGEVGVPLENARAYLLGQYWVDLRRDTGEVPQRLPEVGYVLNYSRLGDLFFSVSANAANMWRESGTSAARLDVYPRILHSMGRDFVLRQVLALRGTAYSYYRNDGDEENLLRLGLEYEVMGSTRLSKRYASFLHVVEPWIGYRYISTSDNDLPVLDRTELFRRTSRFEFGILNRVIKAGREVFTFRVVQEMETHEGDRPFLPLRAEVWLRGPLSLRADAAYDVHTGRVETSSSEVSMRVPKTDADVSFGHRYNREEDITLYKAGFIARPIKALQLIGDIWYDAKGGGLRDLSLKMQYMLQCWGIRIEAHKRPGDFTLLLMFDLAGITSKFK